MSPAFTITFGSSFTLQGMGVEARVEMINCELYEQTHPISLSVCGECADRFSLLRSAEFGNPPLRNWILQQEITHAGECI